MKKLEHVVALTASIHERYRRIPIPFQGRAGTTFVAR